MKKEKLPRMAGAKSLKRRPYATASPVKVTKADGSVEMQPAYNGPQLYHLLGNDSQTRRLRRKGEA